MAPHILCAGDDDGSGDWGGGQGTADDAGQVQERAAAGLECAGVLEARSLLRLEPGGSQCRHNRRRRRHRRHAQAHHRPRRLTAPRLPRGIQVEALGPRGLAASA